MPNALINALVDAPLVFDEPSETIEDFNLEFIVPIEIQECEEEGEIDPPFPILSWDDSCKSSPQEDSSFSITDDEDLPNCTILSDWDENNSVLKPTNSFNDSFF